MRGSVCEPTCALCIQAQTRDTHRKNPKDFGLVEGPAPDLISARRGGVEFQRSELGGAKRGGAVGAGPINAGKSSFREAG